MDDQEQLPGIDAGGGSEHEGQTDARPDWDDYWVAIAEAVKTRSNDPSCQVGAVIVRNNVLLSTGYNGLARGVQHRERRLLKEPGRPEKLRWMCHAEQNAIYNAARTGASLEGATIYTTKFPCLICTNAIVQAGIASVHTRDTKAYDDDLLKDDGSRVVSVLLETGVRLVAPNLKVDVGIDKGEQEDASRTPTARKRTAIKVQPKAADSSSKTGSG